MHAALTNGVFFTEHHFSLREVNEYCRNGGQTLACLKCAFSVIYVKITKFSQDMVSAKEQAFVGNAASWRLTLKISLEPVRMIHHSRCIRSPEEVCRHLVGVERGHLVDERLPILHDAGIKSCSLQRLSKSKKEFAKVVPKWSNGGLIGADFMEKFHLCREVWRNS